VVIALLVNTKTHEQAARMTAWLNQQVLTPMLAQLSMKANRSALMVAASVVHMPCGNPL
jgi:hypothetical protein